MGNDNHIKTKHLENLKQYSYTFVPQDGNETEYELLSSAKNKNGNYSRFDIFLFLQYAEEEGIDFSTLLRVLFYQLSQFLSPDELLEKITNETYTLCADSHAFDGTNPTGMLEFVSGVEESSFANYANLLNVIFSKDSIQNKPMTEEAREKIKAFLEDKAKDAKTRRTPATLEKSESRDFTNKQLSEEDIKAVIGEFSPFMLVVLGAKQGYENIGESKEKANTQMSSKEQNINFTDVLTPASATDAQGLSEYRRAAIAEAIEGKMIGRLIVKLNRIN